MDGSNEAPFLLQVFAARVLANRHQQTISRAELSAQGCDVETLVEMIQAYASVPQVERRFLATATDTHITVERNGTAPAPSVPLMSIGTAGVADATRCRPHETARLRDKRTEPGDRGQRSGESQAPSGVRRQGHSGTHSAP